MAAPRLLNTNIVDVAFGERVTVVQPANLYGCTLGDDCFVGPFVEIQRGVVIGKRCRVQSHTFICELVTIGDDCFVAHGVTFTNDLFKGGAPSRGGPTDWKATSIASHVSIGSGATLLPVSVCSNVVIGAGSVVTKDIFKSGVYAGNPARFIREFK